MATGVAKSLCVHVKDPGQSDDIIELLKITVLHFTNYFISVSSGTVVESKGLTTLRKTYPM